MLLKSGGAAIIALLLVNISIGNYDLDSILNYIRNLMCLWILISEIRY